MRCVICTILDEDSDSQSTAFINFFGTPPLHYPW